MKITFTVLAILTTVFFPVFSQAQQIPNGNFQTWTNVFTPAGWTSAEDIASVIISIDTSIFTFKDTTTFTQGDASIKLVTDTFNGPYSSIIGTTTGVISLGTGQLNLNTSSPDFSGIPFSYRPDSIVFDYKLSSPGVDAGAVFITLSNQTVPVLNVGFTLDIDTFWTHMAISLGSYYTSGIYPDTLLIQFVSSNSNSPVIGTTLHVDGVRFGYTNTPLSVTYSGTKALCTGLAGDSVILQAHTSADSNYTYQWNLAGTPITGATGSNYTAKDTGYYTVVIDSATLVVTSLPVAVSIDNVVATLNGFGDTVCSSSHAITLYGGEPLGGVYSGPAVSASVFTPSAANFGLDTIKYVVIDQYGCSRSAASTILVENCAGLNVINAAELLVYPNPATSLLNINADQDLAGYNLQIYDILGRQVVNLVLDGTSNAVNVAKLANGTYIYRITDKENDMVAQSKFNVMK